MHAKNKPTLTQKPREHCIINNNKKPASLYYHLILPKYARLIAVSFCNYTIAV